MQVKAPQAFARHKGASALAVLIAIAEDQIGPWRGETYEALLNFPDDPRVEPAITLGLSD